MRGDRSGGAATADHPVMIEAQGLTRRYGDAVVVDGLSLQVHAGELLVLLGGSGSGNGSGRCGSVAQAASTKRQMPATAKGCRYPASDMNSFSNPGGGGM